MNHYAQWWDDTITLFNKYLDPETKRVTWYSHVIADTFYKIVQDKITVNNTTIESSSTICRIRVSDDYIDKRSWNALGEEEKKSKFTLATGDIIIAGEIDFDLDEYSKGSRSSDLIAEYHDWPGCFTVESVAINVGGGRGNEHYSARGK